LVARPRAGEGGWGGGEADLRAAERAGVRRDPDGPQRALLRQDLRGVEHGAVGLGASPPRRGPSVPFCLPPSQGP